VTAQITTLITSRDNSEIVLDKIATILLEESAAQQAIAPNGVVSYTRAGDSDYTVTSAADPGKTLELGGYVVTAGTLVAGVGTWTAVSPVSGATEECTTVAADDDLLFPTLGLSLTTTAESEAWETGDVITVTVYDPAPWNFRVFTERTDPWAVWESAPDQTSDDARPIVCVSFMREDFDRKKSDIFQRQHADAVFSIDCYGYGKTAATETGQDPGDAKALSEAHRAARLARRILMAAHYAHLGLRGTVGDRFADSIERFPAELEKRFVQHVRAYRLTLAVSFDETSPQVATTTLDTAVGVIYREETGEVFLNHTEEL